MEQKTSAGKVILQFGALFGIVMVLEFVIGYVLNVDAQTNKTYGLIINVLNFLVLPFVFCLFGANMFKNSNNGFISIGQSLKIGVGIGAFASLIYGIFFAIFMNLFPEYIEEMFQKIQSITIQQNPNMSASQIETMVSLMKKMMNPAISIPLGVLMNSFIALIHSLVVGLIVKKEPASF